MSCLQQLDALEANNWTNNKAQQNHQRLRSGDGTQHSGWHHVTVHEHGVACGAPSVSYVSLPTLHKDAL